MYKVTLSFICLAVLLITFASLGQTPDSLLTIPPAFIIPDSIGEDTDRVFITAPKNNFYFTSIATGFFCSHEDIAAFAVEYRIGLEKPHYMTGFLLGKYDGYSINIFSSWLFSTSKVCPYIGGAVGYGKVNHDNYIITSPSNQSGYNPKKTEHGLELTGNLGILLFRSYNVRFIMNLAYVGTFNDYHDEGMVYSIGFVGKLR
ncbi:MAG TPA: hypothetical protein PLP19_16555 [bacterium]|nr:hypothetical protein [bacterium]HPN45105.1 hypothetical protein [bacterium]